MRWRAQDRDIFKRRRLKGVTFSGLVDHGVAAGVEATAPPIVLLHGLMGRGRTWQRQIPWLKNYGRVFTFDAAWHRGSDFVEPVTAQALSTNRFVADVAEIITRIDQGPATLIGHSMGGLHAWCTAADYPELVHALVVEDMSPDFVGQTIGTWAPWFASWPAKFESIIDAESMFGEIAGRYFYEAFDGGRLHGSIEVWGKIAEQWGSENFWKQWQNVIVPSLLIEAEYSVTPVGQMREMAAKNQLSQHLRIPGAGHLIHDDAPAHYRGAVEAFLDSVQWG